MLWLTLIIAGLFEVAFTTCLNASKGLTRFWPSVGFILFTIVSMYLLSRVSGEGRIPLGTAYAVWTGIGAAGTVCIGILFFKEPVTAARLFFLTMLVGSVVGLKLFSH